MDYYSRKKIVKILDDLEGFQDVIIMGWIRTRRDSSNLIFFEVNDGSCMANLQIVVENPERFDSIENLKLGAAVRLVGNLIPVPDRKHKIELHPTTIELVGKCPADYPLQKKRKKKSIQYGHVQCIPTSSFPSSDNARSALWTSSK